MYNFEPSSRLHANIVTTAGLCCSTAAASFVQGVYGYVDELKMYCLTCYTSHEGPTVCKLALRAFHTPIICQRPG